MGRVAKRVPMDFDWPIGEVWEGFLLPERLHETPCPDCNGRGSTTAALWLEACAHMILMLDDDLDDQRRGRPMHPYFREFYTSAYGTRPSEDIREIGLGLAGRAGGFGHDAIDGWAATRKIVEAAGLDPKTWGVCKACGGHGSTEAYEGQRADAEAWESSEPPTGDGWQMWETTSEGSPSSPVFATAEELAEWCAVHGSVFGSHNVGPDEWLRIITGEDFAHVTIAPGVVMM